MINIQSRTYPLPTATDLFFFRDEEHFARKVRDHFLNPNEPWSRLLGVRFLRRLGQKLACNDVSALEAAYERALPVLDRGIAFAAALPLFVRYQAELVYRDGTTHRQEGYFFVAEPGFRVVAHGGTVCTAYFLAKTPADSAFTLFRQAWKAIKARTLRRQYVDAKWNRIIRYHRVEWFSPENWERCPNPHRKPAVGPRPAESLPPDVHYWLQQVEESVSAKE
jgi:hypothetical protein